jgi:hypothetical protein
MPTPCLQEAAVEDRIHVAIAGEHRTATLFSNGSDDAVDARADGLSFLA